MEQPRLTEYQHYRVVFTEPVVLRVQLGRNPKPVTEYVVCFFFKYGRTWYKTPGTMIGYDCESKGALRLAKREEYTTSQFWPMVKEIHEAQQDTD